MANFNQVTLAGNITRDIELRQTNSGLAVCDIGLAVNDRRKQANGEYVEETLFIDVTLWGRTAEIADQYCQKGSSVLISGKLKMDTWDDKNTGGKRSKIKVTATTMQMLGSGGAPSESASPMEAGAGAAVAAGGASGEDIPF
jgi:single-strand DNA-binding protein